MRILLVVPEFPPHHTGGGGVVFESLAKSFQNLEHEVLIISGDHTKKNIFSSPQKTYENCIDIYRVPEIYSPISLLNTVLPYPFWYNKKLKKIIKEYNPDKIYIHGYGLFMPAQIAKICRSFKKEYIVTLHGAPISPEKMKNPIISWAYGFYNRFYGYPLLNHAFRITAVSEFAKNFDIFKAWQKNIIVIPNGIDTNGYKNPGFDIFEKKGIKKDKDTKIILSIGRIEWIKGFDKIIRQLPDMIQQRSQDIHYVIAGRDNGEKNALECLAKELSIEDKVHFIGFISGEDKMSALFSCDIVAIPSESESYGLVGLEARLAQKPIITTFAGGLIDALKGYQYAYSLDEYAQALNNQVYITNGDISSEYDWEMIAQKYIHIK